MMPGTPDVRKMPGMPGTENDNWEVPRSRSMSRGGGTQAPLVGKSASLNSKLLPQGSGGAFSGRTSALLQGSGPPSRQTKFRSGVKPIKPVPTPSPAQLFEKHRPVSPAPATNSINPEQLKRKTVSLLEEYFNIRILDEALQCVEELKTPSYHSEIVKEAINLGLDKNPPCVDAVTKLLEFLLSKKVFTVKDIGTGCWLYGSMIEDIAIDLPKAPNNFGEIIGLLILAGGVNFSLIKEVLEKIEDELFRKLIFEAALKAVSSSSSGQGF